MLAGAFGERAIELLQRGAQRGETVLDRAGALAIAGPAGASDGSWRCWISGRLTNAGALRGRFGLPADIGVNALIARAHAQLGRGACDLLRGTFIVVAAESERGLALAFRDQLGGRPLVYVRIQGGVLFAEHERDILELLPSTPGPDRLALARWADAATLPPGRTLYDGIHGLPPAHRLVLSPDALRVERYWLPRYEGTANGGRAAITERLRCEAFAAIDRAAVGSRRPAVLLSGGLDSACVAAGLAARADPTGGGLALSKVFPAHPEVDESSLIAATASHTGLTLKQFAFDDRASILAPALEHIDRWRLPPATPNLFLWQPVMVGARELGVDVLLDGEGGDELFGLAPYLIADMVRSGRVPTAWSLTRRIPGMSAHAQLRFRLRALRHWGARGLTPDWVRRARRRRAATDGDGSLLEPLDALAILDLDDRSGWRELDGPFWWRALSDELTNGREALGVSAHLRRDSISAGIDRREPFLYDLELLRTMLANPPQLQFDPRRDRPLLRDALADQIPDAVRTRHAKSLFTPLLLTALATDGELLVEGLAHRDAPIRAYVRAAALDQLLQGRAGGDPGWAAWRRWHVAMADIWLRAGERPGYVDELRDQQSRG